ncbi:hypothetical protein SH580_17600 [Coraliomargarita algicola]|uniref:Uncharacterized protein n=1 Tax=Coraliomargarita algicola TaxID=3092156 RepID=A0ABZ0RKC8_9BACT|nr:hypothetical protein [Coraliomargarita sp. J2-16]WPJ95240.1 hypothetical protein SH580_17600 [Coraliomargarita sp. J2-16]
MAIITKVMDTRFDIEALPPTGSYVATCGDINDQFGVQRPSFDNPQIKELRDVTRFLFGFRGADEQFYQIESFEFRISGSPKANLMKFLNAWLGRPPEYGWDYCELKGEGALITIVHKPNADGSRIFANIVDIKPVPEELRSQILPLTVFTD